MPDSYGICFTLVAFWAEPGARDDHARGDPNGDDQEKKNRREFGAHRSTPLANFLSRLHTFVKAFTKSYQKKPGLSPG